MTHVGGGAATFARYVAHTRPGSPQIVLEPDAALTELVRARLPFARDARVRIRPVNGRDGVAAMRTDSADVVVLDAFHGGRVPPDLTTVEFLTDVARVLRPGGVLPGQCRGRAAARVHPPARSPRCRRCSPQRSCAPTRRCSSGGGSATWCSRRPRGTLPVADVARAAAAAMFPHQVVEGAALRAVVAGAAPLTEADPMRSPAPPDELWRVGS